MRRFIPRYLMPLCLLFGIVVLGGCGKKGPLYLPDATAAPDKAGAQAVARQQRNPEKNNSVTSIMNPFSYRDRQLYAENVRLADIAQQLGTPCYVYSRAALEDRFRAFADALKGRDHLVCYAVKANSNLAVLNLLARLGSGFDIVSGGELERVLAAGGDPAKVVFSGVGKTRDEMRRALAAGIYCFNVESEAELEVLNEVAGELGKPAPVALRVNPDVDPATHPYIATGLKQSKFGIDIAQRRGGLSARTVAAEPARDGHRLPHRLAAHGPGAGGRGAGSRNRSRRYPARQGLYLAASRSRRRARHPL